ncbi:hypothetical protein J4E82_007112 [Alternaria postmessia]|uniref:uncharacterized protein n=1 Tax=Alternaria postmessia TaxID=1187938 RepID=UPI002225973D|nr:uncharacterized protein J4E82_007112 [Alternaria postmessia]KAI5374118.1 hypothetical protein J4E82_007112 [Alternaria postmessia]
MASDFKIEPLAHPSGKTCKFGAVVTGLDLNQFTDETVVQLQKATWEHKLLIIKGQKDLEPKRGWELLQKLDPDSKKIDNTTFARAFYPKDGIVAAINYVEVPEAGAFVFIGKGPQDDPKYGKPGLNMGDTNFNQYYQKPLADADFEAGKARFHWWHVDGTYWKYDPPTFTMLRPIKFPTEGKSTQTVEWADGSGQSMEVKPGRTAFVDVEQLYDMLSDDEKKTVDHSWVEYMYWPYEKIKGCRGAPNGLGVANEGRELPDEEVEAHEKGNKDWQKKLPLVWVNPVTGKKSFQVQHNLARRLFIRNGPNDTPKVIDDLGEVRKFLDNIQGRMIKPEHIWVGPEEEHDILLFQNYGLFHTKIDYPASWGVRTVHQGWLPGGKPPAGPNVIEGSKFKPRSDVNYIDQSDISNLTAQLGLEKRQAGCGGRPSGVSGIAICGPDFVNMGDKGWGPALAAMPQWNHARLNDFERPCYPESAADANGDGPAPGVSADASDGVAVGRCRGDPILSMTRSLIGNDRK